MQTKLTPTERRLLCAIGEFAFFDNACHPSQALLAQRVGISREWTNKLCRRLHAKGYLCWGKARFVGSRWDHNVYRLRHWNPPHVKRVLRWLWSVRNRVRTGAVVARLRSVHTKRTALGYVVPGTQLNGRNRIENQSRAGPTQRKLSHEDVWRLVEASVARTSKPPAGPRANAQLQT